MTDHDASLAPVIHEPTEATAPTEPVARRGPTGGPVRRGWRWVVALVVLALAATATVAGGVLLTGARSPSAVVRWAPADALVYGELRPDLPGDQRDQLAAFLSAFPGFADRSILDQKLTEVYDQLLSKATKGEQRYSADIAPWFGGQLGVAIRPPAVPASTSFADRTTPPTLLVAASTDPAKALAWFRSTVAAQGAQITPNDVGGSSMLVASVHGETIAAAAPTGVLLIGDAASVKDAVGRDGSGGLGDDAGFRAALAALPGDGLATAYVHVAAYADLATRLAPASAVPADLPSLLPAWSAVTVQAGSDALTIDSAAPATDLTKSVPDGPSALPRRLPASTIAFADVHDLGAAVTAAIGTLPQSELTQLETALGRVGGLKGLVGWAGEAAGVVVGSANGPLPGAVALSSDPSGAKALAASISNLATLAGLKPVDTTYAGRTITTIEFPMATAGASVATLGRSAAPARGTPSAISWTVADDLVVIGAGPAGAGPAFVQAVLDTKAGASLADAARFTSMAGRVPSSDHALAWVDLVAVRDAAVARMTAAERTRYQADVAPYLAPFSGAVGAMTHDGSLERGHGLLIVERP